MILNLPGCREPIFLIKVYYPGGIINTEQSSGFNTIDIPDDFYLVIVDIQNQRRQTVRSYGFDRIQWSPYQPEYHNPKRLIPQFKPEIGSTEDDIGEPLFIPQFTIIKDAEQEEKPINCGLISPMSRDPILINEINKGTQKNSAAEKPPDNQKRT